MCAYMSKKHSTHSGDLSLEAFGNGSSGSGLGSDSVAERRPPIETVAPPRRWARQRKMRRREAQGPMLRIDKQNRRPRERKRRCWGPSNTRWKRPRCGGEPDPRSSEQRGRRWHDYIYDFKYYITNTVAKPVRQKNRETRRLCNDGGVFCDNNRCFWRSGIFVNRKLRLWMGLTLAVGWEWR